jgi:hypothetical protein
MEQRHSFISNNPVLVSLLYNTFSKFASTQLDRANVWAAKL